MSSGPALPSAYLPPIFKNIPSELQTTPQWVCWIEVPNDKKPKPDKVPVNARTGHAASVTNSSTWSSYSEAMSFYQSKLGGQYTIATKERSHSGLVAGVGFILTEADPYVGIDIDNCIDSGGKIASWVQEIIGRMGSYAEISPSGKGVRIFVKGTFPKSGHKDSKLGLEVYQSGRYLTVTGRVLLNALIQENQAALDWLYLQHCHKDESTQPMPDVVYVSQQGVALTPEDSALRELMCASASGPKIKALYGGDLSQHNNDHSSADMALCCILAFWCRKDPLQMDRIFRSSALMRDKWDEPRGKETYGAMTIRKAIGSTKEVYRGQEQGNTPEDDESGHTLFTPSPVPLDAFPARIVPLLQEASGAFTVPLQIAVACLLGMLSCLVSGARHISIRPSWLEPGNIWLGIVANSGIGKSPCTREFFNAIKELELKAFKEWKEKQARYDDAFELYKKERQKKEVGQLPAKPVPPKRRQAYVDDCTLEALGGALEDNPKGIMSRPDELAILIASMGQYSAKGNKDGFRSRLLPSYDGDEWKTNRATDPSKNRHVPHAYVSIFGGIQPAMLPKIFEAGATGADEASGFLQRFMFIHAEREKPSYWTEKFMSSESRALLESIANHLWNWDVVLDEYGRQIKSVVRVTDGAKAIFIQWFNALAEEEFFSKNPSLLSKLKGQAQRLVLLLHCLDAALEGANGMNLIPESTMLRGLKLADWIKENQRQCWSLFTPGRQIKQVSPPERAIMQVIVDNATTIQRDGGRIANSILIPQVRLRLSMPNLHDGNIGKTASALGLAPYSDGGRGRIVTEEKINEFRATVGSVDTVNNLTDSTRNASRATVPVPSATASANASFHQLPTVADSRHTVADMPDVIAALGCTTDMPVLTVPAAIRENFETAMRSFGTRYNVTKHTM